MVSMQNMAIRDVEIWVGGGKEFDGSVL